MDINKINEVMKLRMNEGFFGNIQEEEEFDIKSKLTSLLKSGTPDNIELAFMIADGQNFDIDTLTEELFDLKFWIDNIPSALKITRAGTINFLLAQTEINLAGKQLSEIPKNIGNLHNLQTLYLYINNLTSLPESIGKLHQLKHLGVRKNMLTSIPESICNLSNLETLELGFNQINTLPENIGKLHMLSFLHMTKNRLKKLPESITDLSRLEFLFIGSNELTSIPESIGKLENLRELHLNGNQLTSIPESFYKLQKLESLTLDGNPLPPNVQLKIVNFCKEKSITYKI